MFMTFIPIIKAMYKPILDISAHGNAQRRCEIPWPISTPAQATSGNLNDA
jgi:hypothetical protein